MATAAASGVATALRDRGGGGGLTGVGVVRVQMLLLGAGESGKSTGDAAGTDRHTRVSE
jgi:hypothetical protein